MLAKAITLLLFLLFCNPTSVFAEQAKQLPSSRAAIWVNAGRVDVNVMVEGSHGHFVTGLGRDDFRVFDNGVERPIVGFASNDEPAQIVLLIESGTTDYLLAKLGQSLFARADTLLSRLSPADRIAIVTYSDRASVMLDFTSDKLTTRLALRDLNRELLYGMVGSNSLDLSSSLAATLYWLRSTPGKKTIILLSTGFDASSPEGWQVAQQQLDSSDVRVLAVSVLGNMLQYPKHVRLSADDREERAFMRQGASNADESLRRLSEATGGRVYLPRNSKDFDRAYAEIGQLVRHEYSLGFVPASLDGQVHLIVVKVKHPWYRSYHIEYRRAYIADISAAH